MRTSVPRAARRPRLLARALLLAGVAAAFTGPVLRPAEAADQATERFRDPNAKFSFLSFPTWDQVPLETEGKSAREFGTGSTDKFAVCQFFQSGAERRGLMPAKLVAYRMGAGTSGLKTGAITGEDTKPKDPFLEKLRESIGADDPKSMRELFKKVLADYGFPEKGYNPAAQDADWDARKKEQAALAEKILDPKLAKPLKSKDAEPVPGLLWAFERGNYMRMLQSWKG